jgi:hypothetical protein
VQRRSSILTRLKHNIASYWTCASGSERPRPRRSLSGLRRDAVFLRLVPARRWRRLARIQRPHNPDPRQHVAAMLAARPKACQDGPRRRSGSCRSGRKISSGGCYRAGLARYSLPDLLDLDQLAPRGQGQGGRYAALALVLAAAGLGLSGPVPPQPRASAFSQKKFCPKR